MRTFGSRRSGGIRKSIRGEKFVIERIRFGKGLLPGASGVPADQAYLQSAGGAAPDAGNRPEGADGMGPPGTWAAPAAGGAVPKDLQRAGAWAGAAGSEGRLAGRREVPGKECGRGILSRGGRV